MLRCLAICLFLPTALSAQNNDWTTAIKAVRATSEAYIEYGLRETGTTSVQGAIGLIGMALDVEKHRCAIIGRMLGKIEEIAEIEQFDYTGLTLKPEICRD